jgi:predicted peroxiredoxin
MYNSDTELLFPLRVAASLSTMRGKEWQDLVEKVSSPNAELADQMGFVLMMVRMDGCVGCNADSFRAMKGCTLCARQNIRRFRGNDRELVDLFQQSKREVELFLDKKSQAF